MYIKGVQMWTFDELFVYTMSFEIESENLNFPLHLVGLANYNLHQEL